MALIFPHMEYCDNCKRDTKHYIDYCDECGQSPQNHATPKRGSEDKGLEGQALGSERAERPLS